LPASSSVIGWLGRSILRLAQISIGRPSAFLTNWPHNFTGFASHWNKNSNFGQAFDVWFLNILPRASRFAYNEGGYLTLSFIPTLGTLLLACRRGNGSALPLPGYRSSGSSWPARFLLPRVAAALYRDLPDREAHLDAKLDPVQRGVCFFFVAASRGSLT